MRHGINEENWENYLDGKLPPEERDRIEAHIIGCVACWEFQQRMLALNARLREVGAAMDRSHVLSDEQLSAGLRGVYAMICAGRDAAAPPTPVQQRLDELAAVMTVFCGTQAAASALQTAAQRSPARSLKQVTRENWEPFLQRLSAIAHVLCGRTGAHLVWESGRF
ncbi:MAG TPA: zf-HC2 domain-containing protein [Blastocatellia bacterium]|nr:zf-HC2 domain-containing protein [Blastocatellia bacterium]HMV85888.1 zf-HC2 domain-containing protein [Blastocatellia bacterium]HMY73202.1 zf-HC2 domain-containing protein [Blastocatellia bacterium]HMZ22457.1 zf-HC2 domain-containing protein [Blastocatellia bacterium]HNG31598.1 zf-HC2 domain-containing protein [Blastocatellia bacterium]